VAQTIAIRIPLALLVFALLFLSLIPSTGQADGLGGGGGGGIPLDSVVDSTGSTQSITDPTVPVVDLGLVETTYLILLVL